MTRDTWTLDLGASASRTGGANTSGIHLREYNLLGTGTSRSVGRSNGVDRSGGEFGFFNDRAFGTAAAVSDNHASNSDGRRDAFGAQLPFRALDTRRAAGLVSDVLHVDLAFPLDAPADIRKVQFLVKTKTSFRGQTRTPQPIDLCATWEERSMAVRGQAGRAP